MPLISEKKYIDPTWDFKLANTKADTHCYHNYPAMMIPQIASRLITQYGVNARTLFDPYCGSGTSLLEANLKGIDAYGTDINPLAQLIAKTKTSRIELKILDLYLMEFNDFIYSFTVDRSTLTVSSPDFKHINFWFKPETKSTLSAVKKFIDNIEHPEVRNFFLMAFSETVRESSLTRNGEFKLFRMSAARRNIFNPDVFGIMNSKLTRNRQGLKSYLEKINNIHSKTTVYNFNSTHGIGKIEPQSIDIVISSPPYGDSKTTVAYGQFSRLTNQWLGVKDAHQIDNQLMGGKPKEIHKTGLDIIDKTIAKIAVIDQKRAKEVYSFYVDYSDSIINVSTLIKNNGYVCYVVGNRRVKDTTLPTDEITKALFEQCGFEYKNTFIRTIPHKRMPSKNSPTNKPGEKSTTINNEYIVVLQKH